MNVTSIVLQCIIALVPITASFFAFRQAGRATRTTVESTEKIAIRSAELERDKVDALAFERAKAIYESSLSHMERTLERVEKELREERDLSRILRGQVDSLERQIRDLQAGTPKEE